MTDAATPGAAADVTELSGCSLVRVARPLSWLLSFPFALKSRTKVARGMAFARL